MNNKQWKRKAKINKLNAIISANILTIFLMFIIGIIIASILGGCSNPAVVYKSKEVYIPTRCDIELPPLPNVEGMSTDEAAVEIAKAFELTRSALLCCVKGLCE